MKPTSDDVSTKAAGAGNAASSPPSWLGRDWLWGLILVLAVILVYQPVWYAGFIWDDDYLVTANPCMIGWLGLKAIWTTGAADICPLVLTTFWVEHALWGLTPLPYHLVNVLLHGGCAVLLWQVLRSLRVPGAWLGAALWALHPVQVESVAWIAEMKNTESGLFFLLSIFFFVRWLSTRDPDGRTGGGWNYVLTLLFAALAMTGKSSTVILPVVLCLCAWWVEDRWHWSNLVRMVPVFLMSIAASALSVWTQVLHLAAMPDPQWVRPWSERVAGAGDAIWFYLGKLVWPHPLITVYPRWEIDAGRWYSYLSLLSVIIGLSLLWRKRESWSRPWFFVFAYFLTALFPVLGLVGNPIFRFSLVFDHFQYLADMGPLALVGAGLARFADLVVPGRRWLQTSLCTGILLTLGVVSWKRVWIYESQETLWTDTLTKNPNCWGAYNGLGDALLQKGQVNEAMTQLQKALKINPNYDLAHINLGDALFQKGKMDEATAQFQKALEINPNCADAYNDIGGVLLQKGQVDEAMAQFQKALEINPSYADAHNNLGWVYLQKGRVDEAIGQYQEALEINPNIAVAHNHLGKALLEKGKVDEAMAHFQKALEIDSNYMEAHDNLGLVFAHKGQMDQAIVQFQKTLEINPNIAAAHNNLGNAFLQKGWVDEAMVQYQKVLAIDPNDVSARTNLAIVFVQKGKVDEAIAQLQEVVRLKPDDSAAKINLAKAQAMARSAQGSK